MVAQLASFGRYELESLIGRGGMGEVYRAFDREQRRVVALKLLPESLASDDAFVERFRRESYAAARLRDPHVLPIHQYGEIDGRLYIDMRLVDGRDLAELLQQDGRLDPRRTVYILRQTAQALHAAHADNLVHRDVKPSNILIDANDFAYLVDFGIAHAIGKTTAGTSLTSTGSTVGTLAYMAPERFTGRDNIDGRVDVYALACVLFEMLTGQRPFPFDDLPSLLNAHLNTPPPKVTDLRPELPAAWDEIVARGMAKQMDDRYGTPTELVQDAERALGGAPVVAVSPNQPRPAAPSTVIPPRQQSPSSNSPGWADAPPTYIPQQRQPNGGYPPPAIADTSHGRSSSGFGIWVVAAASILLAVVVGGVLVVALNLGSARGDDGDGAPIGPTTAADGGAASGSAGGSTDPGGTTESPTLPDSQSALPPVQGVGDLGLSVAVSRPACDGSYAVFVGGAIQPDTYAVEVQGFLDRFPGSSYLFGEASCGSLRARTDQGNSVYAVYYGPYSQLSEACIARSRVGGDSFIRRLDNTSPVGQVIGC